MAPYLAYIRMNLRLTMREKSVVFFNYVFPLIFFFVFSIAFQAERGGVINMVFAMILVIGILGNGLFGGGIRMVLERDANILRRFKVAPISPAPILVASLVVGLVSYLPSVLLTFLISKFYYGMATPEHWPSLVLFIIIAVVAFRSIGLIIASVANSMGESQILTQLIYFPMMFLSGSTFPTSSFPNWLQTVTQFIPATHINTGVQGILIRKESFGENIWAAAALVLTTAVAIFICMKIFRWEKEEKLKNSAKLWVAAALLPFVAIGVYQSQAKTNLTRQTQIDRQLSRSRTRLIRDARLILGDGRVIERGGILIRDGKIAQIFEGASPEPKSLNADTVEGAGKTVMPGLIDAHIHIGAPGGFYDNPADYAKPKQGERALAAYLYSGVTATRSVGDWLDAALALRKKIEQLQYIGADYATCGPIFTVEDGHPTELIRNVPAAMKANAQAQFVRLPKSPDEARGMVRDLKKAGVDCIKGVFDAGQPGYRFNRATPELINAMAAEAKSLGLPVAIHTGSAQDVADAITAGANSIEHGSMSEAIPDETFARMAKADIAYDPTLSVLEGMTGFATGRTELLEFSLVQQAVPAGLLASTRRFMNASQSKEMRQGLGSYKMDMKIAGDNLVRAHAAGVRLVTGTDAGNPLVFHGPAVHREMKLWVAAGLPPGAAIQGATGNAAKLLGIDQRTGTLAVGKEATILLVDGNPLADISATERITLILLKGERIIRPELFTQE
ncbi:MAG: amidohydrolase family protein [Bryobacteraceae bacterium]|nr:amidohydrolase family protein [Bryobacteraceae bacterium]